LARASFAAEALAVLLGTTSVLMYAMATEATSVLTGQTWQYCAVLVRIQRHTRNRLVDRGYGRPGVATRTNPSARSRVDRYPHGITHRPSGHLWYPCVPLAPTRFGNVFAAMKQRIKARYQIRIDTVWNLFQSGLERTDERDARELRRRSALVVKRAEAMIWVAMMGCWALFLPGWQWLVAGLSACVVVAYAAYRRMCGAACAYCDYIEDMMRKHFGQLYEQLHLPPPEFTSDLRAKGRELTKYYDTGTTTRPTRFAGLRPTNEDKGTKKA
jgi:hypothetical protein